MTTTTNLNIRTDKVIKKQAEDIFNELGLNMTTAINIFLRTAIREHGCPQINTEECNSTSLRRGVFVLQVIQIIYRWEINHANCHRHFEYHLEGRRVLMLWLCLRCHPP